MELVAFILIIDTHTYLKIKQHSFNTAVAGFVNSKLGYVNYQLNLSKENKDLSNQNANLLNEITNKSTKNTGTLDGQFSYTPCYVIGNQYIFKNNSIVINIGSKNGVLPEMGVIGTNGIIGIVQKTSDHFSQIISVLNTQSKISVSLKGTNHYGFLAWNAQDPNVFDVLDIPLNAKVAVGDTLVTSGKSSIFPKGIFVGKIVDFKELSDRKSYKIVLQPFIDMTSLGTAYVIQNKYKKEFDSISKTE